MQHSARRVLLIGLGGADWRWIQPLLDNGELPNLERWIEDGVMGNLASVRPLTTCAAWTSLTTGMRPVDHGLLTVAPQRRGEEHREQRLPPVPTLWERSVAAGLDTLVVGWPAYAATLQPHPRLRYVGPAFGIPAAANTKQGVVLPASLRKHIASLRMRPHELRNATLGLESPKFDTEKLLEKPLEPSDRSIRRWFAHGASLHAAATWLLERVPWRLAMIAYPSLAPLVRQFGPYAAPPLEDLPAAAARRRRDVVRTAYAFHDAMLGRLSDLAPDAALVLVSPHGMHSGDRRPHRPTPARAWHSHYGVVCLRAPGVRADERIYGASVLDIVPTVLWLLGQPVPTSLPGRPLARAFEHPAPVARTTNPQLPLRSRPPLEIAPLHSLEEGLLRVQALLDARRDTQALHLLERLHKRWPNAPRVRLWLAGLLLSVHQLERARTLVEGLLDDESTVLRAEAWLIEAQCRFRFGQRKEALQAMRHVESAGALPLRTHLATAKVYMQQQMWPEAERSLRAALRVDSQHAATWSELAGVLLRQGQPDLAAEAALRAVGLLHHQPLAHFRLGIACTRLGMHERAEQAFETCLKMRPGLRSATRALSRVRPRAAQQRNLENKH